jgi:hypothetical protein
MKALQVLGFKLMRKMPPQLRNTISSSIAKRIGKLDIDAERSSFIEKGSIGRHIASLCEQGYTELDRPLPAEKIEAIKDFLGTLKCYDPYHPEHGDFSIDNVPPETHVGHYRREDLVSNPDIMAAANDEGILKMVQEFLGAKPTISNVTIWWSFGGRSKAEHAQLFHRDLDDYRFCKLFIYLTDVSSETGPHIFVKNSSNANKLLKIRRYTDEEIKQAFGQENIIELSRPKGSAFLVNTYGFHKGMLPKAGNRLLLQVQYSLKPIAVETYHPGKRAGNIQYDNYINRLLLEQK